MAPWYSKSVFYHIYPLGLTDAPRINFPPEEAAPDASDRFRILMKWIPYMKELGITALYIGPLFESDSHGYDTRDFYLVDRRLGTNEDLKQFVLSCHEAGIRVILDGVFNHTGRNFFAFRDLKMYRETSRYCSWYKGVRFDWGTPLGDSFSYEPWQGHFELAALNLQNPEVRDYLLDTVSFWIREFDIDGLRLDCANVLDFDFMKALRYHCDHQKKDFWLMGEVIHGDYNRWANPEMLHSVTNYELHKGLYSGHNDYNCFEIAHTIRRQSEANGGIYRSIQLYTFVDNHDEDRISSKLKNPGHLMTVYFMLFTLPGIPSVYYGSEWGIPGTRTRESDVDLRPAIDPDSLPAKENDTLALVRRLAHLRSAYCALQTGAYQELLLTNRQYAYARTDEEACLITAVNIDDQTAQLTFRIPANGSRAIDLLTDETFTIENNQLSLTLDGCSGRLLKIEG